MDILKEILGWSLSRPPWQQVALKRLVKTGGCTREDVDKLLVICKASHGLTTAPHTQALDGTDLAIRSPGTEAVTLASLVHHRGVNALSQEQTISFGTALTLVYGQNAAGKSGYTRILKRVCRARGGEEI